MKERKAMMLMNRNSRIRACLFGVAVIFSQFGYAEQDVSKSGSADSNDVEAVREGGAENPPVAPSVNLKEVALPPVPEIVPAVGTANSESVAPLTIDKEPAALKPPSNIAPPKQAPATQKPEKFIILGSEVPPATATRLAWSPNATIAGLTIPTPVLVINGKKPGKTLCMTAAIHGDELNGVEIIRRVMYDIDPEKLSGKIVGIPIVNLKGFQRASRYLSDRRDLNRAFPGDSQGSLAARIAHSLFNEVIVHCDRLIDLHTGSLRRTNLLQVRADMTHADVIQFTHGFDDTVVVHSQGEPGMLRHAAVQSGIPAVTLEAGESMRLQADQVEEGVKSIYSLLKTQEMYSRAFSWGDPEPTYYQSRWLRADAGGILFSRVELGGKINKGEVLGTVADPITNEENHIVAPFDGRIIGMAVNQVVMPGFAAYHIGIKAPPEECMGGVETEEESASQSNKLENGASSEDQSSLLFECASE